MRKRLDIQEALGKPTKVTYQLVAATHLEENTDKLSI